MKEYKRMDYRMTVKLKKKGCIWFSVIGVLFYFFSLACKELEQNGNIIWDAKWTVGLLAKSILLGVATGCILSLVLLKLEEVIQRRTVQEKWWNRKCSPKKTFLLVWGILFLCWLPAWLAYYPGICSYDITIQMGQIAGGSYNTHHPLAHTLLFGAFWNLGKLLGNVNIGVGLYSLLQMAVLAVAFATVSSLFAKWDANRLTLILLTVYEAFLPVNWYLGITATKDVLFSVFVLLSFFFLYAILRQENGKDTKWHISFILVNIGVILFRNNGLYALAVLWVVLGMMVFFTRKQKIKVYKKLLLDTTLALCVGFLLVTALAKVTNAQEGDKREMLSMPIQQLARTMIYHGGVDVLPEDDNTIDEVDKALIRDLFMEDGYQYYRVDISDPVKKRTNTSVVRYRPVEFAKTYLSLLVAYPGDYINATLGTNAGFLYPGDKTHAVINVNGRDVGLGYIQTRWVDAELNPNGIVKDSKWSGLRNALETFADQNTYLKVPVLCYLIAPGAYLWCYLLLATWLFIHKKYKEMLPLAFVLGYFLTLFLGPTVQLRYLYPLMIALPYLLVYACVNKKDM